MIGAILYFYGINLSDLKKIGTDYYFKHQDRDYTIFLYDRNPNEALEIYYLNLEILNKGVIGYDIILTKGKEVLFLYENKYYILMQLPDVKNRVITYNDILKFNYKPIIKIEHLDKSNWSYNWSNKIDFIEYQFDQIKNKYKKIDESINYFIGIWENGISYFNDNYDYSKEKVITHKRISANMDLLNFLNPLNFIIDYKERDIGDYIKSYAFKNNYSLNNIELFLKGVDRNSIILIISRLLFPSYYFDIYEDIVLEQKKETDIYDILNKKNNVIKIIAFIIEKYQKYNIPVIAWIKNEV